MSEKLDADSMFAKLEGSPYAKNGAEEAIMWGAFASGEGLRKLEIAIEVINRWRWMQENQIRPRLLRDIWFDRNSGPQIEAMRKAEPPEQKRITSVDEGERIMELTRTFGRNTTV